MTVARVQRPSRDHGAVLMLVLIIVSGVGLLALSMHFAATAEMASTASYRDAVSALLFAEAGIEHSIAALAADSGWRGTMTTLGWALDRDIYNGHYQTWVWDRTDDPSWDLSQHPSGTVHIRSRGDALLGGERTIDVIVTPPTSRGIVGFAVFACTDLLMEGGADWVTGGDAYAGDDFKLTGTGTYTNGDIYAIHDAVLDGGATASGDVMANHKVDPKTNLATVIAGDAAADQVNNPARVAGTVTTDVTPVPEYCDSDSADYGSFVTQYQPLTQAEVAALAAAPGVTSHIGDWDVTTNTLLTGTHHVPSGKWKVGEVKLTYDGHVVVIVDDDVVEFNKTMIRLAVGSNDAESSLTIINRDDHIEFRNGADADFRGVMYVGVIDDVPNPDDLPTSGEVKIDGIVRVRGSVIGLAKQVKVAGGERLEVDASVEPPPVFRTGDGLTVQSWSEGQ